MLASLAPVNKATLTAQLQRKQQTANWKLVRESAAPSSSCLYIAQVHIKQASLDTLPAQSLFICTLNLHKPLDSDLHHTVIIITLVTGNSLRNPFFKRKRPGLVKSYQPVAVTLLPTCRRNRSSSCAARFGASAGAGNLRSSAAQLAGLCDRLQRPLGAPAHP